MDGDCVGKRKLDRTAIFRKLQIGEKSLTVQTVRPIKHFTFSLSTRTYQKNYIHFQ